jgi:ABC-2 type transport system ATP-binding protein
VTVGVDPQSRSAIFDLLEKLNRGGMTIVYTTHYIEEVQRLCQRIAVMDRGRVLADGSLDDLLSLLPEKRSMRWAVGNTATLIRFESDARAFGSVRREESGHFVDLFPGEDFDAASFFARAQKAGLGPWDFSMRKGTLEDVFLHLTGRKLRDK